MEQYQDVFRNWHITKIIKPRCKKNISIDVFPEVDIVLWGYL